MAKFDLNSRAGTAYFNFQMIVRWAAFSLGAFLGLFLGVWPFSPSTGAAVLYAFFLTFPIGLIGGPIYLYRRLKKDDAEHVAADADMMNVPEPEMTANERAAYRSGFVGLYAGVSTGMLAERGHASGVSRGYRIDLSPEDCAKNIIVFGGIGAGKTTRSINRMLYGILTQNTGALIFDIKTDFGETVQLLAEQTDRTVKIVGDGGMTLNLFRGCSPELAASYLKSCFLAQGQGHGDSAFWVDSAVEACRHGLTLLNLLDAPHYSIAGLYDVIFSDEDRDKLLADGAARIDTMSDRDQRLFVQSQRFWINVWNQHDEKLRRNIMGTINAVLSPFAHPDLVDAFSEPSTQGEADMSELLRDGAVFLVNLPMTKYGREGARFAYLLIKLRFFDLMRGRKQHKEWDQSRHVAFICDEYQAIVDPISDGDFWDKSRSTKTVGIVSMQGVASLVQALGGNRQAADAILQNFRQRFIYRTEDEATLRMVQSVLGQVDVEITSESYSDSVSVSNPTSMQGSASRSTSASASDSYSMTRQDLFGANDMRGLDADYCLFIGNVGSEAADEVLHVKPLYVEVNV